MKPNSSNLKNILIAVGSIVLLGIIVYYFFNRNTAEPLDSLSAVPAGEVSGIDGDLLSTLRQLKSLKLDGSVFSNAIFVKLVDFSQPLIPQPMGRSNPFAPISSSTNQNR